MARALDFTICLILLALRPAGARGSFRSPQGTEGGGGSAEKCSAIEGSTLGSSAAAAVGVGAYSVMQFGAKGDGSSDDTRPIQDAIDAAGAAGGGTVVLPSRGVFVFRTLIVKSNVRVVGLGATLKLRDGACVDGKAHYPINNLDGRGGGYSGVVLDGLRIDGNGRANSKFRVCDTVTLAGENVHVRHCTIEDSPDSAIMISRASNSSIVDNRIAVGRDVGIYVNDGDGTQLHEAIIARNQITGFRRTGIALKRIAQRTIVAENTIHNCGNGITLEQASTAHDYATNVTIALNWLRHIGYIEQDTSQVGIDLRASRNVICLGNRLEDISRRGIYLQGAREDIVSNNMITGGPEQDKSYGIGIDVGERDGRSCIGCVIEGNIVSGQQAGGIRLGGHAPADNNLVVGNIAIASGGEGLNVGHSWAGSLVAGNVEGSEGDGARAPWLHGGAGMLRDSEVLEARQGHGFVVGDGTWNGGHLLLGDYHFWVDRNGKLRMKRGPPRADSDGAIVGAQ